MSEVIYVVTPSPLVTGPLICVKNMAEALQGKAQIVLVAPTGLDVPDELLKSFVRVQQVPLVQLSKRKSDLLRYVPALLQSSWHLRRLMRRDGCQRIVLNDFYLVHGAVLRLLGYRGQIISYVRCHPRNMLGRVSVPLLWLARLSANRLVAVSHYIRTLLPKDATVDVIYDCFAGTPRAPKQWSPDAEKKLVFIGNYITGKGQDVALQAFATVAAQHPKAQLHFYGSDMGLAKNAAYLAQLKLMNEQLNVSQKVMFHGFAEDTQAVLSDAYVALNASVSESFSMTVLEAQGLGLPALATACGGPQEIVQEGITGFLVPVGDVEAYAERLQHLLQDEASASQMGQAAAQHIAERFHPRQFQQALEKLFKL